MNQFGTYIIWNYRFAIFVIITDYVSKCWQCSSSSKGQEFCNDPFDATKLTDREYSLHYIYCMAPPNRETPQPNPLIVCRKIKLIGEFRWNLNRIWVKEISIILSVVFLFITENDTVVINRNCFWQEINDPKRPCVNENLSGNVTVESCELCDDADGCNHSSRISVHFVQIFALIAIPLAFVRSLLL